MPLKTIGAQTIFCLPAHGTLNYPTAGLVASLHLCIFASGVKSDSHWSSPSCHTHTGKRQRNFEQLAQEQHSDNKRWRLIGFMSSNILVGYWRSLIMTMWFQNDNLQEQRLAGIMWGGVLCSAEGIEDPKTMGQFYRVIVQAILLYGSAL